MDQKEIKKLLDKYYDGATTETEELFLLDYLSGHDVPEEFSFDKEWFMNRTLKVPKPSDDFNRKLLSVTYSDNEKRGKIRSMAWSYGIAAGFMLLIAGYLGKDYLRVKPSYMKDTYNDPELAMAEVRRVLGKVSGNITKGTEPLSDMRTLGIAPEAIGTFTRAAQTARETLGKINGATEKPLPDKGNNATEKQ